MEVGQTGISGQDVQSPVEVEPGPDQDLVPIRHLNRAETVVQEVPNRMAIATLELAQVSLYFNVSYYSEFISI